MVCAYRLVMRHVAQSALAASGTCFHTDVPMCFVVCASFAQKLFLVAATLAPRSISRLGAWLPDSGGDGEPNNVPRKGGERRLPIGSDTMRSAGLHFARPALVLASHHIAIAYRGNRGANTKNGLPGRRVWKRILVGLVPGTLWYTCNGLPLWHAPAIEELARSAGAPPLAARSPLVFIASRDVLHWHNVCSCMLLHAMPSHA